MATTPATPTPQDKFSFGLWTVGWTGIDPFGSASRPALEPWDYVKELAQLGAWGITFHDNDVFAFDADERAPQRACGPARASHPGRRTRHRDWSRRTPSATPSSKTAGLTSNDRGVRRFGLRKVLAAVDIAAELGRRDLRHVGAAGRAANTTAARTSTPAF